MLQLLIHREFRANFQCLLRQISFSWLQLTTVIPFSSVQWKQWTGRGKPTPKKAKRVPSAEKVMAPVFWDAKRILLIDYFEKEKIITGVYCDHASAHSSRVAQQKLSELILELLSHPAYLLDGALSDCHLFRKPRTFLAG